jgi:hypothetical protein
VFVSCHISAHALVAQRVVPVILQDGAAVENLVHCLPSCYAAVVVANEAYLRDATCVAERNAVTDADLPKLFFVTSKEVPAAEAVAALDELPDDELRRRLGVLLNSGGSALGVV